MEIHISHTRGIASPTIRRELRRRNAIEPVIGHMKQDGLLERNPLKGAEGDVINVMLCAVGHNLRLLLAWYRKLLLLTLAAILFSATAAPHASPEKTGFFTGDEIQRFEVINGAVGRRRWSADDRARILEETLAPEALVSAAHAGMA